MALPNALVSIILSILVTDNLYFVPKQAVGGRPPWYAPPLYAARCGPAPAHTRLTPDSSSCGRHYIVYSRCTRLTSSDRCQIDVRRQTASLLSPRLGGGPGH